jgi:hypothetical protein
MEIEMNRMIAALSRLAAGSASAAPLFAHEEVGSFRAASGPGMAQRGCESFAGTPSVDGGEGLPGVTASADTPAAQVRARAGGVGVRTVVSEQPPRRLDIHLPSGLPIEHVHCTDGLEINGQRGVEVVHDELRGLAGCAGLAWRGRADRTVQRL